MYLYFAARDKKNLLKIFESLKWDIVLIRRGHFPSNVCIWMGLQNKEKHSENDELLDLFRSYFELGSREIQTINSLFLPEYLIWDSDKLDSLIVFGDQTELAAYVNRLCAFSGNEERERKFSSSFIYRMECNVENGADGKKLVISDYGFLYQTE